MKKIEVVKSNEVKVETFVLDDFTQVKTQNKYMKKVSKQELKVLAKSIGLNYSGEQIAFSKKLITAYLAKQ